MLAEREMLEQCTATPSERQAASRGPHASEHLEYELDGKTFRFDDLVVIVSS